MVDQQPADPVPKEQVYKFHVRDAFFHKIGYFEANYGATQAQRASQFGSLRDLAH